MIMQRVLSHLFCVQLQTTWASLEHMEGHRIRGAAAVHQFHPGVEGAVGEDHLGGEDGGWVGRESAQALRTEEKCKFSV